jgi:hypothetical protein
VKFTARQPGTNVNVSPTHPLKEFAVLAGGLLAIAVGVYLALGLAVDLIVPRLSMELEKNWPAPLSGGLRKQTRWLTPPGLYRPLWIGFRSAAPRCPIRLPFTFSRPMP